MRWCPATPSIMPKSALVHGETCPRTTPSHCREPALREMTGYCGCCDCDVLCVFACLWSRVVQLGLLFVSVFDVFECLSLFVCLFVSFCMCLMDLNLSSCLFVCLSLSVCLLALYVSPPPLPNHVHGMQFFTIHMYPEVRPCNVCTCCTLGGCRTKMIPSFKPVCFTVMVFSSVEGNEEEATMMPAMAGNLGKFQSEKAAMMPSEMVSNLSKFQPEKEKQHKSLTLLINDSKLENFDLSTHSVVDDIIKETEAGVEEPDIVKSTKNRTPPGTLPLQERPPVPPPRRKKRAVQVSWLHPALLVWSIGWQVGLTWVFFVCILMHPPLPSLFIIDTFTGISLIKSLSLGVGQSRKQQAWVLVFHVCVTAFSNLLHFQASSTSLAPELKTIGLLPLPSPMLPRSSKGMEALLNSTEEGHINTEVLCGALLGQGGGENGCMLSVS